VSYRWHLLDRLSNGYRLKGLLMTNNNTFTITLTPFQALQTKRGYENEGYQVNMMEIASASFIDGTYKYFFSLTNNNFAQQNNTILIEGATA